jgi:hypothetical protein
MIESNKFNRFCCSSSVFDTRLFVFNPLTPELIKSLRATLPEEIFTGDFAS